MNAPIAAASPLQYEQLGIFQTQPTKRELHPMTATRAERQQKFIAIAAAHAEDFKQRVAQHDRENSFAHENVAAMKASGYTNMTAPAELGGGGADILDEVLAQGR